MKSPILVLAMSGAISISSLAAETQDPPKPKVRADKLFNRKDSNGDGKISKEEFIKDANDVAKAESVFKDKDKDGNGELSREEFQSLTSKQENRAEAKAANEELAGEPAPDISFIWSSRPGLKTLSSLRGKVVLLDFWASWCGPCVASFPELRKLAEHYRGYDVEILGVTSLQGKVSGLESQPIDCEGDPEKEKKLMATYMKVKNITWNIGLCQEHSYRKGYKFSGIPHMALITPDGKIYQSGMHASAKTFGSNIEIIDALLRQFSLKAPPAQ